MSDWSDALYLAAANKRHKYQGAKPLASLSATERRQLTSGHVSRSAVKAAKKSKRK